MPEHRSMKVLGMPLGSPEYIAAQMQEIRRGHDSLLAALGDLPELQSSWFLVSIGASARAKHYLRTLPPRQSIGFARNRDEAILHTLDGLLDRLGQVGEDARWAREVAQLPLRAWRAGLT